MKSLLNQGKTPKQAVEIAYKKYPVMQTMQGEIEDQLGDEMSRGYGMRLDPDDVGEALALSWSEDGLTLSERTTAGSEIVKGFVRTAIADELRKGTSYTKLARKIFDGYKQGGLIPEQDIPQFMHDLYKVSAGHGYTERAFNADFKEVKRYLNKLNTPGMRAAYNALSNAIAERNEEKLDRALYQSTQERTRYYAERIARTEMARAYNDGAMAKYMADDDVEAVQWKMSGSHPSYDICDLYATADLYGLGPGIFPKDKVPILPAHPNCMCHLKPIIAGTLKNSEPRERFEQGAREYISKLSKYHIERLFGVYGAKQVQAGKPISDYLRNYSDKKLKTRLTVPIVKESDRVTIGGNTYVVDGKHVFIDHDAEERTIAKVLSRHLKKEVLLIPRVAKPPNIRTPDYLIDGDGYDLKTPLGSGKNTVFDMIKHGKGQANNFIVNIDKTPLSRKDVLKQIDRVFTNTRTDFVHKVVVIENGKVITIKRRT